ncbi:DUF4440 domain-containing protein [Streptomyces sp. ISL-98]|uniref:nuclear transport factor 2 family protein n=1 Tax=Streptomyces sp. ISL-98 TaxID=2819192 RepID=UPI0027E4B98D|nr:DUF4440 domain-containing protein [Streptomyces sp. ISL-98]
MTDRTSGTGSAVDEAMECELRLLDPDVRNSAELLAELLHPEFSEFGVSGRRWDRESIIEAVADASATTGRAITTMRMKGVQLAPDLVQLTFDTNTNGRLAHRSSLWRLTEDRGWLLYFHQGTPYEE